MFSKQEQEKESNVRQNMQSIIMYALSMVVALGVNSLMTSVFDSFYNTEHIISKTTYVVITFGLTLVVAYWLSTPVLTE